MVPDLPLRKKKITVELPACTFLFFFLSFFFYFFINGFFPRQEINKRENL